MEETTTNQTPKEPRNIKFRDVIILMAITVGIMSLVSYSYNQDLSNTRKQLIVADSILLQERVDKTNCIYLRDSLAREVIALSAYKTLSTAMACRDKATTPLEHKVGDLVYMKNDSAKVVIQDIIIGGSQYNYYIMFRVLYRDNTLKEITPELVY